jgi:hypothetical protein
MARKVDLLPVRKTVDSFFPLVPQKLEEPNALCSLMDCFLKQDIHDEKFYRASVHKGIIRRYRAALLLFDHPGMFAQWCLEPLVLGLPRRPQTEKTS